MGKFVKGDVVAIASAENVKTEKLKDVATIVTGLVSN